MAAILANYSAVASPGLAGRAHFPQPRCLPRLRRDLCDEGIRSRRDDGFHVCPADDDRSLQARAWFCRECRHLPLHRLDGSRLYAPRQGRGGLVMAAANPTAPQPVYLEGSKKGFGALLLKIISKVLFFLVVAFILIYTLFPFIWAIISSVSPDATIAHTPTKYWPDTIDWSHYKFVLNNGDFIRAFRNSVIVSVCTVIISLIFGSFAAYALGRMKFRGRTFTLYLILSMTMFPQ